jgi:hypothetical protein
MSYFPFFLKLDLLIWGILILVFIFFSFYIYRLPIDAIKKCKAQSIENKKRLGIKIYRMK